MILDVMNLIVCLDGFGNNDYKKERVIIIIVLITCEQQS